MSDLQSPPDPADYLNRELSGRFIVDALDALTGPDAAKIRASVYGGSPDPALLRIRDEADARVAAIRRAERAVVGRQAGLFGGSR